MCAGSTQVSVCVCVCMCVCVCVRVRVEGCYSLLSDPHDQDHCYDNQGNANGHQQKKQHTSNTNTCYTCWA